MTGPKTNERPGTRAVHRYARVSAYKAREVLDMIRGETFEDAVNILGFSERAVARDILKVVESAAANAAHTAGLSGIATAREEFYATLKVVACYADEGPTLRRWRPRARGRATRIRKRTCHITVILDRMDPEELAMLEARSRARAERAGRPAAAGADRRRRVERSRRKQEEREAAASEADHDHDHDDHEHDHDHDDHEHEGEVAVSDSDGNADSDADSDADDVTSEGETAVEMTGAEAAETGTDGDGGKDD